MTAALDPAAREPRDLTALSDTQLERFARHLSLDGFGPEAQLALLRSRVLVVGAGGLGAPVLTYLAAAGVGEVHVIDDDMVDRSNLHRQVIHAEADLGRPKTASAAATSRTNGIRQSHERPPRVGVLTVRAAAGVLIRVSLSMSVVRRWARPVSHNR